MENENIISSGQQINDVYFIIDGEVEIMNNSAPDNEYNKLRAGQYFGGIIQNITQLYDIKATKITKVAVIEQSKFVHFIDAYPEWYNSITKYEKVHKLMQNFMTKLKGVITQRKKKQINAFNLLKKALTLNPFKRQGTASPTKPQSMSYYSSPKKDFYVSVKNSPKKDEDDKQKEALNTLDLLTMQKKNFITMEFPDEGSKRVKRWYSSINDHGMNEDAQSRHSRESFPINKDKLFLELQNLKKNHSAEKVSNIKHFTPMLSKNKDDKSEPDPGRQIKLSPELSLKEKEIPQKNSSFAF